MRVSYIMMRFPLPSETFAVRDIKALESLGVTVDVHTLRAAHKNAAHLRREREVNHLPVYTASATSSLQALWESIGDAQPFRELLRWILALDHGSPHARFNSYWFALPALAIFRRLRADPPDVVHLFWGHYPALVGHLVQQFLPDVRLSMFVGAYDLREGFGGTPAVLHRADLLWTHARANVPEVALLSRRSPEDVRVVPRGLSLDHIDAALQERTVISGKIVTTGRLIEEKGMDDALRVLRDVRDAHPQAHLVVLGEGPARADLEKLAASLGIEKAVTFRGHVSEDAVARELAEAEAFVLLSRKATERLPNAVKEAMAADAIAITTRTPGIEELVEDGVSGFVVPQKDWQFAARRLREVLGDRPGTRKMRERARLRIEEQFEVQASMRIYKEAWERVSQYET